MRLYKSLCLSVCRSIHRSVGHALAFFAFLNSSHVTAPAQPHATDAVVYTALLIQIRPHYNHQYLSYKITSQFINQLINQIRIHIYRYRHIN